MKKIILFYSFLIIFIILSIIYLQYTEKSNFFETSDDSSFETIKGDSDLFPVTTFQDLTISENNKSKYIWVDNSNVLFTSCLKEKTDDCESFGLLLWNTKQNTSKTVFETNDHIRLICQKEDTILMMVNKEEFEVSVSNLSDIKVTPKKEISSTNKNERTITTDFRCVTDRPKELDGHFFEVLRPGDGYVDLGSSEEVVSNSFPDKHIELVSEDLNSRTELEITRKEAGLLKVNYLPSQEKYLFYNINLSPKDLSSWQQGEARNIWFVESNGKVEKITIPNGPWSEQSGSKPIFPLANGLLINPNGFKEDDKGRLIPGSAGIYFIPYDKKTSPLKLLTGRVDEIAISPDGCGIVFNFTKDYNIHENTKTGFINICK